MKFNLKPLFSFKQNLFRINDEEVSGKTKVIFYIYILFMSFLISGYVQDQRGKITSPEEKASFVCMDSLKNGFEFGKIDYLYKTYTVKSDQVCKEIDKKLLNISNTGSIKNSLVTIKELNKRLSEINEKANAVEYKDPQIGASKITGYKETEENVSGNMKNAMIQHDLLDNKRKEIIRSIELEKQTIYNHSLVKEFNTYIISNKEKLKELEQYRFYYSFYKFISSFLFLSALALIVYGIRKALLKKGHLIFSHLFYIIYNISLLYLFGYLFVFIFEIMPKYFLKELIQFLNKFNLMFILQYLVILLVIVIFAFVIKYLQKRKNSETESIMDRKTRFTYFNNNTCFQCGSKLKEGNFCSYCGNHLIKKCQECETENCYLSNYCKKCGVKLEN